MNTKKKIIAGVIAAFVIIATLAFFILPILSKEQISMETFLNLAEQEKLEYQVNSQNSEFKNSLSTAELKTDEIRSFFVVFDNADRSSQYFAHYEKAIDELPTGNTQSTSMVNVGNYQKYKLTSNGQIHLVIRVNETLFFISANNQHSALIDRLVAAMDY